jgi:excinuclease ABC subunit C
MQKKGIGEATIKRLLNVFGTFEAIETATFDDIKRATNIKVAKILKGYNESC